MELSEFVAWLCYFGPTPLAALLAGWQASQCRSSWQAFFVALIGTIALAVVFGIAADYLPVYGHGLATTRVWQMHLLISPVIGIPVGLFCAHWVHQRTVPPSDLPG